MQLTLALAARCVAVVSLAILGACGGGSSGPVDTSALIPSAVTSAPVNTLLLGNGTAASGYRSGSPLRAPAAQNLSETALLDWAQTAYSQYFPGSSAEQVLFPYVYRYYPSTGNFLAVANGAVYVLGPVSGGVVMNVGSMADYACRVGSQFCGEPDARSAALAEIQQVVRSFEASYASDVPRSYEAAMASHDACWLDDGQDKAYVQRRWSEDRDRQIEANLYRAAAVRTNFTLESLRDETNSDGTSTRYASVRYDVIYPDGTRSVQGLNNFVYGSSKPLCAAHAIAGDGENRPTWRFAGNGRQVESNVLPVNVHYVRYSLQTGASAGVNTRSNQLEFSVHDYRGLGYTYVVVTGPTLPSSGIKLLFPTTLRDAPELQGKSANYLNADNRDGVRICSYVNSSNVRQWDADRADCVQYGGGGRSWSLSDTSINDTLVVGAAYTFQLYTDDGWKTPGGHLSNTPALTYTDTLPSKPFDFTKPESYFPGIHLDPVAVAVYARTTGGTALVTLHPTTPPAGALPMAYRSLWMYSNGLATDGLAWPKYKQTVNTYPAAATTATAVPVLAKLPEMSQTSYAEVGISTTDRNGRYVSHIAFWN